MPFPVADLGGVSGTREAHNRRPRLFLRRRTSTSSRMCRAAAEAFQDDEIVRALRRGFRRAARRTPSSRIEYAQDTDGFWLKPHTDIGVKMFTMLIYMSDDPRHADLGTDIYADENTHVARSPFEPNSAMIFVPSKQDLARLREAADPGRAALDHRQLRDQRLAGARAARLSAGAGARQRGLRCLYARWRRRDGGLRPAREPAHAFEGRVDARVGPFRRVRRIVEAGGRVEDRAAGCDRVVDRELAALRPRRRRCGRSGRRASRHGPRPPRALRRRSHDTSRTARARAGPSALGGDQEVEPAGAGAPARACPRRRSAASGSETRSSQRSVTASRSAALLWKCR